MQLVREVLRIVGWVTFSVVLVLLVPSSAWSAGTESPQPSPSSSPSDGSSSPAPTEPSTTPAPEPSPSSTPPAEPSPSETPTTEPSPTVTETVTVQPEPVQADPTCTPQSPCVMEPSKSFASFLTLVAGVSLLSLLGLLVRSFGR